jgi:ribosomal RNA-processing protein 7
MAPTPPQSIKKPKSVPKTVADFTILPLTLPTLSGLPDHCNNAHHYIYVKPHSPSIPSASDERSLFIVNVPIDASESNIRALFSEQLGGSMVERVDFDSSVPAQPLHKRWKSDNKADKEASAGDNVTRGKKRKRIDDPDMVAEGVVEDADSALPRLWSSEIRRSGSGAVVVFVDKKSARGAMKEVQRAVKEGTRILWKGGENLGVDRKFFPLFNLPFIYTLFFFLVPQFLRRRRRRRRGKEANRRFPTIIGYKSHTTLTYPSAPLLQASLNAYLSQFNALEAMRNRLRKTARSVPDEDGFVSVVRGGRVGPARLEDAEKKKAELDERKRNHRATDDFYRFQNRERRKKAEGELKRKFEEDRRRVEGMRERRGKVRPEA